MEHPDFLCLLVNEYNINYLYMIDVKSMKDKLQFFIELLSELTENDLVEVRGVKADIEEFLVKFDQYFTILAVSQEKIVIVERGVSMKVIVKGTKSKLFY
jgi:hypothetical protein